MSTEATAYVTRHVRDISTAQRAVLQTMADMANAIGTTRVHLGTVAKVLGICRRQVERHVRVLRKLGHIARQGRTWSLPGVWNHDPHTCGHEWCTKQAGQRAKTGRHGPTVTALVVWEFITNPWRSRQPRPTDTTDRPPP